jgi:hypothetical protein
MNDNDIHFLCVPCRNGCHRVCTDVACKCTCRSPIAAAAPPDAVTTFRPVVVAAESRAATTVDGRNVPSPANRPSASLA